MLRSSSAPTHVLNPAPWGIFWEDCSDTLISGCTILDSRQAPRMRAAVQWRGPGEGNMITCSRMGAGTEGDIICPPHVHVSEIRRT